MPPAQLADLRDRFDQAICWPVLPIRFQVGEKILGPDYMVAKGQSPQLPAPRHSRLRHADKSLRSAKPGKNVFGSAEAGIDVSIHADLRSSNGRPVRSSPSIINASNATNARRCLAAICGIWARISALPTGEYCPKGLVCLRCTHAQPKQSAAPIFRRMLVSHERALGTAREHGEPAGQIAARQLEVSRISHALRRAEELPSDVAAAIEGEA